jgi:hypothetical protein
VEPTRLVGGGLQFGICLVGRKPSFELPRSASTSFALCVFSLLLGPPSPVVHIL